MQPSPEWLQGRAKLPDETELVAGGIGHDSLLEERVLFGIEHRVPGRGTVGTVLGIPVIPAR